MNRWIGMLLGLALALCADAAHAKDTSSVVIDGKTYGAGLKPKNAMAKARDRFFAPSPAMLAALPENYDARDVGCTMPIKDQGSCGSCYAFGATRALECAWIKAGVAGVPNLAEQDRVSNSSSEYGCGGGFLQGTFEAKHGVTDEASCPYKGASRAVCKGAPVVKATKWALVGGRDRAPTVDELRAALVEYGMLTVTVAAGRDFSPTKDGEMTRCGSRGINHIVTLGAYRKSPSGNGYDFLIDNSWSSGWGKGGRAWSKQGCNQLASAAGDAAMFFYVEGQGPGPQPVAIDLPEEIVVKKGGSAALHVKPVAGVTYEWSTGQTGEMVWVQPSATTTYSVKAKKDGAITEESVTVSVQ